MKQAKGDSERWRKNGRLVKTLKPKQWYGGDFLMLSFCFICLKLGAVQAGMLRCRNINPQQKLALSIQRTRRKGED